MGVDDESEEERRAAFDAHVPVSDMVLHQQDSQQQLYVNSDTAGDPNHRHNGEFKSSGGTTGFVRAFIDSTIPRDLRDNTVGIVTGDYSIEKKTLLHHAATSDQYDLFSSNRRIIRRKGD